MRILASLEHCTHWFYSVVAKSIGLQINELTLWKCSLEAISRLAGIKIARRLFNSMVH